METKTVEGRFQPHETWQTIDGLFYDGVRFCFETRRADSSFLGIEVRPVGSAGLWKVNAINGSCLEAVMVKLPTGAPAR